MTDCLQEEIERLAKIRKDQMTERLRNASKVVIGNIHDNPELLKGGNHGSK